MNHPRVHTQIVKVLNNSRRERYHSVLLYGIIINILLFLHRFFSYIHKAIPLGIIQLNDSIMSYNLKNNFFYYIVFILSAIWMVLSYYHMLS